MPRMPARIIQNVAPGPPIEMAMATPATLPMPTVPERAVLSAWKWVRSPGASARVYRPRTTFSARPTQRTFGNRKYQENMNPAVISQKTTTGTSTLERVIGKKTTSEMAPVTGEIVRSMRWSRFMDGFAAGNGIEPVRTASRLCAVWRAPV